VAGSDHEFYTKNTGKRLSSRVRVEKDRIAVSVSEL
jgi:hypothetical protein